jgi:hypothetical protein
VRTLRIDDTDGLPVLGTLMWQPVRRPLGISAFGINAYTAGKAGDEVVEEHTEQAEEEAYVVIRGHATFTVDGEEIDAPRRSRRGREMPIAPSRSCRPQTTSPPSATTHVFRRSRKFPVTVPVR